MRPRGTQPYSGILTVAGLLALLGLGVGGVLLLWSGVCNERERAIFEEFPQYGSRQLEPEPNLDLGSCHAFYQVEATENEVSAYFANRLRANGWKVEIQRPPPGSLPNSPSYVSGRRDGYRYEVTYNPLEGYGEAVPGGKIAVEVVFEG